MTDTTVHASDAAWEDRILAGARPLRPYRTGDGSRHGSCRGFTDASVVWNDECGVGAITPRPSPEDLARFYADEYRGAMGKSMGLEFYRRSNYYALQARSVLSWIEEASPESRGTWIDLGAGHGMLLDAVAHRFPAMNRIAIEPSASASSDLRRVASRVYSSIDDLIADRDGAAVSSPVVVSSIHVLEHLHGPLASLAALVRVVPAGARFVLEVPNDHRDEMLRAGRASDLPHLWFFSLDGLTSLVEAAGLVVLRREELGVPTGPTPLAERLSLRLSRLRYGADSDRFVERYYRRGRDRSAVRVLAVKGG